MPYRLPNNCDIANRAEAVPSLHGKADTLDRALAHKGEAPAVLVPRRLHLLPRSAQSARSHTVAKTDGRTASRLSGRIRRAL